MSGSILGGLFGASTHGSSVQSCHAPPSSHVGGQVYSFARLQHLYERLIRVRESDLDKACGGDSVVELIRQITEMLIWGEQHDQRMFDFFCEKNILSDFVKVLRLPRAPKKVKLQLLQTLQMLIQNIRHQTSMYYLLSNNHVNRLISSTQLDLSDEEVLAYYITLMKSLSLRLDTETIKFFFIQHHEAQFPLYTEATKFFGHRDQMVRAAARTITLQVYRIKDGPMQQFVLRHAAEEYFGLLALHLRDLWLRLDVAVGSMTRSGERELASLQSDCETQQDLQIYLSDVFELEVSALNEVLADRLLNCVLLPVLLSGITSAGEEGDQRVLMPTVALFLLRQVLDTFRSPVLLEPLVTALLQSHISAAMTYLLPQSEEVATSAAVPSDLVDNHIRRHFLCLLGSCKEAQVLLAAAVVHGCMQRSGTSAQPLWDVGGDDFLEPQEEPQAEPQDELPCKDDLQGENCPEEVARVEPEEKRPSEVPRVVLLALVRALQFHRSWQCTTLEVYIHILLDVFLGLAPDQSTQVWEALLAMVRSCLRSALEHLLALCADPEDKDRGLLDKFAELWDQHKRPLPNISTSCSNPRCLLEAGAEGMPDEQMRRAVHAFLFLRRLLHTLETEQHRTERRDTAQCWAEACNNETTPLTPDVPLEGFVEGTSFDCGDLDRIVCGVSQSQGKCTQYLVLHPSCFLLVQPDLSVPGQVVAKTVRPIWQVHSAGDRSEPRTLQVAIGEGKAAAGRNVSMCLSFKDVQSAHSAAAHLQKRRQELRRELLHKALAFTKGCLEQLPQGGGDVEPA